MTTPAAITASKLHGLGNDFLVLVDLDDRGLAIDGELAQTLCDRRTGVGADGLILGRAGGAVDLEMVLFNSDGSRAAMSGNGIRCLAHAVARSLGRARFDATIATDAGPRAVSVEPGAGPLAAVVSVGMGVVGPGPGVRPWPAREPDLGTSRGRCATADVGNPHLVVEVDDPGAVDLETVGPVIEAAYRGGINIEFIAPGPAPDTIDLVVWERGAGVTRACGTGATAAAAIASRWGLVGSAVRVLMPGGSVDVELGATATLYGPSVHIATIEIP